MFVILRSEEFETWLLALADPKGKARIVARLRSAQLGNLGDCEPVGEGVSEMRVHVAPVTGSILRARGARSICC